MSRFKRFLKKLGPGFITGASDDDPSGIATYTQAGAQFGYGFLWLNVWCLPFMIAIQEMVARIGMVTGEGLVAAVRRHYSKWLLVLFVIPLFIANTLNLGADLGAMADAFRLLIPGVPFSFVLLGFTAVILALQIQLPYRVYVNILRWLSLALLCYLATAIIVTPNWWIVIWETIIPSFHFNREFILMILAIIGTTISPYLFIWQASEEVEEEVAEGRTTLAKRKGATSAELKNMRADVTNGMASSQLIAFCIMATAGAVFFPHGLHDIQTSAQAAQALAPLAGKFSFLLFAFGVIGTGLLAVPILSASASYAVTDALGWTNGLYRKPMKAKGFYLVILVSTLVGMLFNFFGVNPIKALIWTAALNGMIAAPILLVILLIANNKRVMGSHTNGRWSNVLSVIACSVMAIAAVLLFVVQ
jgi:NRAMP (natural resistance-associated macrophage protein)-like metal ion transporter